MDRFDLGWSHSWDHLDKHVHGIIVRITARHKRSYNAIMPSGEMVNCYLSGKSLHSTESNIDIPVVGDWCVVGATFRDQSNQTGVMIDEVLPRCSKVARMVGPEGEFGATGKQSEERILAANIDYVFIVTSLNKNFNVNRLRRYVLLALEGAADPVIVLSKSDLFEGDNLEILEELKTALPTVPCLLTSTVSGSGIADVRRLLSRGKTGVFIGSSGVGKSTLVNTLMAMDVTSDDFALAQFSQQQLQKTVSIRESDDRGRHTTSSSGLFQLPGGGMIVDTPGLREVQVLAREYCLDEMMAGVVEFAAQCKFSDCTHTAEPGCQVQFALDKGALAEEEFSSYTKLQKELSYNKRKLDHRLANEERKRWKKIEMDNRRRSRFESTN